MAFNIKELADAMAAHKRAIDLQKQREKNFAEASAKLEAAKAAMLDAVTKWKQAKLNYENHSGSLAVISKDVQSGRSQISTLQNKNAVTESALNNYLFTNRALLNLN